jgi:leader peptidase (prepilin peptidase)/N-methyltransferase
MSDMAWHLDAAWAAGVYGVLAGLAVPAIIGRLPEPRVEDRVTEEDHATLPTGGHGVEVPVSPAGADDKERYADIARLRGLGWRCSLATAVVAALLGGRVGLAPELSFLLYLAPVGVALAVVDWRTRLLPTRLIAPSYLAVVLLAVLAAWVDADWDALVTAGGGWLLAGGTFFALWFVYPKGMGYGDVRLSGVLGIALGYLGWAELLTGVYAGFLIGGVGGLLLSLLRIVDRKAYPFGPFMLVGAVVGVLAGPYVAGWYV